MEKPEVEEFERNLSKVFSVGNREVAARAVRLAVLYEDLRIEYEGAKLMSELNPLDKNGEDYRRLYFIRRSLVTMIEFSGALSRMNAIAEWRTHVASLEPEIAAMWTRAVAHFSDSHKRLEEIRGDLGGHFKESAALFAVGHFQPDATGKLMIRRFPERKTAGVMFGFAHEVVAVALRRTMETEHPTVAEIAAFMRDLFEFITKSWQHAVSAVTVLAGSYFVPQFT